MGKYWLNNLRKNAGAFVAGITMSVVAVGCMDTDDTMGSDSFIDNGYSTYIGNIDKDFITENGGFITKTRLCDSIASDNLMGAYLGSFISDREGQINYSLVNEVSFSGVPYPENHAEPFGKSPKLDSAFLYLDAYSLQDSPDVTGEKYSIYVYELNKKLPYGLDSTYYSNFKIEDYIGDEPTLVIDAVFGEQIIHKIPVEYAEKFMLLTNGEYTSYDKFREVFKGFYFKTSKASSGSNLAGIDLSNSGFKMNYHNFNEEPDTTSFSVDFIKTYVDEYYGQVYQINRSFNIIDRDERFMDPIKGIDIELSNKEGEHYVSGMAGYITTLEITEDIIKEIREKMVEANGGSKIFVSNATMTIPGGDFGVEGAIGGFGAYQHFQPSKFVNAVFDQQKGIDPYMLENYLKNTIQDYSTYYGTSGYFGGYYNSTTKKYRINVTSLIQGLVNGTLENRVIELAPHFAGVENIGVASFKNSESDPITLKLTYSVVR